MGFKIKRYLHGLTLVEVLVVIALFGIFLSAVGVICVQGIRAFHKSKNRLTTQQEAQLALDKLCRELNESYEPGVKIKKNTRNGSQDPNDLWDAVCFPTSRDGPDASGNTHITAIGKLCWNRYIIYYKKLDMTDVYRRVIDPNGFPTDPNYPEPLTDTLMMDFLQPSPPASSGTVSDEKKMAREIYNISFDLYNPTLVDYNVPLVQITVESRVESRDSATGYESTVLTTTVKPTNK